MTILRWALLMWVLFRWLGTLDHGSIHSSLCLAISVSFVLVHFTTCIIFVRIRKYLSQEVMETLVYAFIMSRIDYCNGLLYGLPNSQLAQIQRVLNASARLVCNAPRFCDSTPIMRDLHWLPVKARINFKVLHLTFKALRLSIHGP